MEMSRETDRGFTLVEVLVAFVILALSMGAVMTVFSDSLRTVRTGQDYAAALALARARLAEFEVAGKLEVGSEEGESEAGYRWRIDVLPFQDVMALSADSDLNPRLVTVTVSEGGLGNREVSLQTVRLAVVR